MIEAILKNIELLYLDFSESFVESTNRGIAKKYLVFILVRIGREIEALCCDARLRDKSRKGTFFRTL